MEYKNSLNSSERETSLSMVATNREEWSFWTTDPVMAKRLEKKGWVLKPVDNKMVNGWNVTLPVKAITFRSRAAVERPPTQAQIDAGKRLAEGWKS